MALALQAWVAAATAAASLETSLLPTDKITLEAIRQQWSTITYRILFFGIILIMSFKMDVEEYLAGAEQVLCNFPSILCRLCRTQRTKEALTIINWFPSSFL